MPDLRCGKLFVKDQLKIYQDECFDIPKNSPNFQADKTNAYVPMPNAYHAIQIN